MIKRIYLEPNTFQDFSTLQAALGMRTQDDLMQSLLKGDVTILKGESIVDAISRLRNGKSTATHVIVIDSQDDVLHDDGDPYPAIPSSF